MHPIMKPILGAVAGAAIGFLIDQVEKKLLASIRR